MNVKVIWHYQKDDVEFMGDYSAIDVYFDDDLVMEWGDGYHDNSSDRLKGVFECLDALGIQYTKGRKDVADSEW